MRRSYVVSLTLASLISTALCLYFGYIAVKLKTDVDGLIVSRVKKSSGIVVFDDQVAQGAIDLFNLPNDIRPPRHDSSTIGWIARFRRRPVYMGFGSDESFKGYYGANDQDLFDVAPFILDLQGLSLCSNTSYSADEDPSAYRSSINITDGVVPILCAMPHLRYLAVDRTDISANGLGKIATIPTVEVLSMSHTRADDSTIKQISTTPNPRLYSLNLTGTLITDAAASDLSKLVGLKELYISSTRITDETTAILRKGLSQCRVVGDSDVVLMNHVTD